MTEAPAAILSHEVGLAMAQQGHIKGCIPESIEAPVTDKLTTLGYFEQRNFTLFKFLLFGLSYYWKINLR